MTSEKPFAPSAERNKQTILTVLQQELTTNARVLEYGTGTGQHLTHFATAMPHTQWMPSDLPEQLPGINLWVKEANCQNILNPIELDLRTPAFPSIKVTACYTSNTFHIVSWTSVQQAFRCSASLLAKGEKFLVYGPFSVDGRHNSQGNLDFNHQLRTNNPESGIRDITELDVLADEYGFLPARVIPMPANNQLLVWVRG